MIGNNSCGVHAMMAGRTADNVRRLEVLTYDGERMWVGPTTEAEIELAARAGGRRGEIYRDLRELRDRYTAEIRRRYPDIPRRVSGYNLDELLPERGFQVARALVGTESTCVLVLQAELELVHSPPARVLAVLGYEDVYRAGDDIPRVREYCPIGLEGMDHALVEDMEKKGVHTRDLDLYPRGKAYLLVEFGGETPEQAKEAARRCVADLERRAGPTPTAKVFADPKKMQMIWEVRESGLAATARVPGSPDAWPGWEDSAVPPDRVGEYLRELRALLDRYGYHCALYGHFGQGCIHTRIDFDLGSQAGIAMSAPFSSVAVAMACRNAWHPVHPGDARARQSDEHRGLHQGGHHEAEGHPRGHPSGSQAGPKGRGTRGPACCAAGRLGG
jgi:FAD/FMN-containing dehydrogenase